MPDALAKPRPKRRAKEAGTAVVETKPAVTGLKRLLAASCKGGVGKTGLARNIAVAAAQDGLRVIIIDTDEQRNIGDWLGVRPEAAKQVTPIAHVEADLNDIDRVLSEHNNYDLMIIDTPTAIEQNPAAVQQILLASDFVLVPTGTSKDDINSVSRWMRHVREQEVPCAYVLNRVRRNVGSLLRAKLTLQDSGPLCPFDIPLTEDFVTAGDNGLSVLELRNGAGSEEIRGLWKYIRAEMGL